MTLVTIHPPRRHIAEKFTTFQTQATSRVRPLARARALSPVRRRGSEREREGEGAPGVERARETRRANRTERESTPPESTDRLRGQERITRLGAKREGDTLARTVLGRLGREPVEGTDLVRSRFQISRFSRRIALARRRASPRGESRSEIEGCTRRRTACAIASRSREDSRAVVTCHRPPFDYRRFTDFRHSACDTAEAPRMCTYARAPGA